MVASWDCGASDRVVACHIDMGDITITANNDVSFGIERGELAIILGSSGAGKSTVLNILGGMDTNSEGKVIIDGVDARSTTHLHIHELSVFLHLTFLLLIILVLFPLVVQNLLDVLGLYLRLVLQRLLNRLFFRLLLHLDYVIENLSLTFSSDLAGRFELL